MMKLAKIVAAAALIAAVPALAACEGESASADTLVRDAEYPQAVAFDDYDGKRAVWESNPVADDFLAAVDDFAYGSAAALLQQQSGENVNYSPLSLYYALAVAAGGAGGETQQELLELLGVADIETLAEQCGNLYRRLYTDNEISQLQIATSLWLADEVDGTPVSFSDAFLDLAADAFYASIHQVDFSAASAGAAMSDWVAEHSRGVLEPQITTDDEQLLSILNTVYYYDQWISRFDAGKTAADTFYLADGGEVEYDFMNQTFGSGSYARGENYTRSQLALKGQGSMIFVLPDEGVDLTELIASPAALAEALTGGEHHSGEVIWQVPKLDFGFSTELSGLLRQLGVESAFSGEADFSALSDAPAWISSVSQQTHIAIDENGVEAASFTQIDYAGAAMPEGRAEMILNRPFLYALTANNGMIAFIGVCYNPAD